MIRQGFCKSCRIQVDRIFFRFPDPDKKDKNNMDAYLCEVCGKLERLGIIDMNGNLLVAKI